MTLAAIEESRLGSGVLTLDGDDYAKQATEVRLTPSVQAAGDKLETLSGAFLAGAESYDWTLNLGFIQDFDDPIGLVNTLRDRAGQVVQFVWQPNGTGPSFGGTVRIRPTEIGGGVNVRLTGSVELPVVTLTS